MTSFKDDLAAGYVQDEEVGRAWTDQKSLCRNDDAQASCGVGVVMAINGKPGNSVVKTRIAALTAVLVTCVVAEGAVAAQEANQVFLDASYLGASTDWCPADAGVPLVVKMDGPDIIDEPKSFPKTVVERKGGQIRHVQIGENIASFNNPDGFGGPDAPVIGRFFGRIQNLPQRVAQP